ncbi:MAG: hypothetical protein OEM59_07270 [Rhodospirillales bacterium]|nr:hypothetical protein [Rhodospirillales bacterium]
MALRFALRFALIGLLALAGAVSYAAPGSGAPADRGAWAGAAFDAGSSSPADDSVKRSSDPAAAVVCLFGMPLGGEDEESAKALASWFAIPPLRGADPFRIAASEWLARPCRFLSPLKTGPPLADS